MTDPHVRPAPPRLSRRLLRWAVGREADEVDGELHEAFQARARSAGHARARWWYRRQVLGFVLRSPAARRNQREGGMGGWHEVLGDVRWALRGLRKRPTFTAVAVGTLALGIGSNSAIFTLVSAQFLAPLPWASPNELVLVWEAERATGDVMTVSPGQLLRLEGAGALLRGLGGLQRRRRHDLRRRRCGRGGGRERGDPRLLRRPGRAPGAGTCVLGRRGPRGRRRPRRPEPRAVGAPLRVGPGHRRKDGPCRRTSPHRGGGRAGGFPPAGALPELAGRPAVASPPARGGARRFRFALPAHRGAPRAGDVRRAGSRRDGRPLRSPRTGPPRGERRVDGDRAHGGRLPPGRGAPGAAHAPGGGRRRACSSCAPTSRT